MQKQHRHPRGEVKYLVLFSNGEYLKKSAPQHCVVAGLIYHLKCVMKVTSGGLGLQPTAYSIPLPTVRSTQPVYGSSCGFQDYF